MHDEIALISNARCVFEALTAGPGSLIWRRGALGWGWGAVIRVQTFLSQAECCSLCAVELEDK